MIIPTITVIEITNCRITIYFLNEDYGFICGLNFIYYTDDGGNSWKEPLNFPGATTNWWLREFTFVNENTGYVCGDIGQVYKTTDKGINWEWMENTTTDVSLQAIIALDENNLFACGYGGTVIRSTDGGLGWHNMTAASGQNFYSINFTPSGIGFVCSQIGEVLRYIDPYTSVNNQIAEDIISVFPNPFQDHTLINYELPQGGFISLVLFDANGRRVKNLFTGQKQQGKHTFVLDAGELHQGIYFVKLDLNRRTVVHKIVKGK